MSPKIQLVRVGDGCSWLRILSNVDADVSRPELPGLTTNESANTIPRRSRTSMRAIEVALWKPNTNFRIFEVTLHKKSFLSGSNSENIEQILNITLNIANLQWLHYFQYLY